MFGYCQSWILSYEMLKISSFIILFHTPQINKTIHLSVVKLFSQLWFKFILTLQDEGIIEMLRLVSTIGTIKKWFCQVLENLRQNAVIKEICASLKIRGFDYVYKKIIVSEPVLQWLHQSLEMNKFLMEGNMD